MRIKRDSIYPDNLLQEIFSGKKYQNALLSFPDDIEQRLDDAMSRYEERSLEIMLLRYKEGLTLQRIGEIYGISRERVNQIIAKMIRRLKNRYNVTRLLGEETANIFFPVKVKSGPMQSKESINT